MENNILKFTKSHPYYEIFSNFGNYSIKMEFDKNILETEDGKKFKDNNDIKIKNDKCKIKFPTVEHYFQAVKFELGSNHFFKIINADTPQKAKSYGKSRAFPIRKDWNEYRLVVMENALKVKFAKSKLRKILDSTKGQTLVEGNIFDNYWGCGKNGKGQNMLGKLLMKIRDE